MSVYTGTLQGAKVIARNYLGIGAEEVWEVTASVPAYTASSGSFLLQAVGAALSSRARDGKTRTLSAATCPYAGIDASGVAVYATSLTGGAPLSSTRACNVSTDDIKGCLGLTAGTTATNFAASQIALHVYCDLT
jgi:hypothetical protein